MKINIRLLLMTSIVVTFFCFAVPPSPAQQLKNQESKEPDETITYRVDNYNVTATLFPDQEPQAFIIRDTLILGFKCHGKYEGINKEDTLDFICVIPYHFPLPEFTSTFENNWGLNGCTHLSTLSYTPLMWFSGYASNAAAEIGKFRIYPPEFLDAKGGMSGDKISGMYRIKGDFELNEATLITASAAPECDHSSDIRMEQNIYPWYDPACVTLQKKKITNGHFSIKIKMLFI